MKCERCGMENYDETYYCRGCGLPFGALDKSELGVMPKNNSEQTIKSGSFVDNNIYTKNLYSTENASKQDEADTKDEYNDNFDNNKENDNSNENLQSASTPKYIYNKEYDFYSMSSNSRRESLIVWDKTTILIAITVAFAIGIFLWISVAFGSLNKEDTKSKELAIQATVQATQPIIQATQPTEPSTYLAELSYSKHTITDFSGEKVSVQFSIPKGYQCEDSVYNSYAVFSGVVDGGAVARLSTTIFESDIEKEINYYEGLLDEDEKPLDVEVTDTDLGEMTTITLKNSNNATIYQVYVKLDKKNYFHISLSNIPDSYKKEAEKLINLIVEDTKVEFMEEKEEDKDKDKDKDKE